VNASVVVIPAPFDATTTYGTGTANGPEAILRASTQVDLHDHRLGEIHQRGLFMEDADPEIRRLSRRARTLAEPLIERVGASADDSESLGEIEACCVAMNVSVARQVRQVLDEGKTPGVVGGEHSVSFGAIEAVCERFGEVGILQVDAHMDLRPAYGGLTWSHASVMYNALDRVPGVTNLVQVGIRDYDVGERRFAESTGGRVRTWFDDDLFDDLQSGDTRKLFEQVIGELPEQVYITFDIDGLDAMLCPNTGTPVPGGLTFREISLLLGLLGAEVRAGRKRVVGFDLVEVCPGREDADGGEWDANVGARVLYKLCGLTG
jgi:agmatinase